MKINFFKILIILIIIIVNKKINKFQNVIKISIIVPIFNSQKYLSLCLESIIHQTLKFIEIICINDGSKDKSLEILKNFQKKDNRIKIISKKNKGSGIARNYGIKKSKGKFIAFMDSDDMYPNNFTLELLYNKSIQNNALICGGGLNKFKEENNRKILINDNFDYLFNKEGIIDYSEYEYDFGYFRFLYNKKFIIENNLYFSNYLRYQDPPFFIKAMHLAKKFYALNEITYLYRKNHKNITWNEKKVIDLYNGFNECLFLSKLYNLKKLYCKIIKRLNIKLFLEPTRKFINNTIIKNHIYNILKKINFYNLKNENCSIKLKKIYYNLNFI